MRTKCPKCNKVVYDIHEDGTFYDRSRAEKKIEDSIRRLTGQKKIYHFEPHKYECK